MVVLSDTTGIWGLYFSDSVYHNFMTELKGREQILIPKVLLIEIAYPVHEAQGIQEMKKLADFIEVLAKTENIMILDEGFGDIVGALRLCEEHSNLFKDEKDNLSLFDALLASIWKRTRLTLYTTDNSLKEFGKIYGLEFRNIERN